MDMNAWRIYPPWLLGACLGRSKAHSAAGALLIIAGRSPFRPARRALGCGLAWACRTLGDAFGQGHECAFRRTEVLPGLVELVLVIERVQAKDEAGDQPEDATAAAGQACGFLHLPDAFAGIEDRDERRNDDQRAEADRHDRDSRADLDLIVQVVCFSVDLVPPDQVIDAESEDRPHQPYQDNVPGFSYSSSH